MKNFKAIIEQHEKIDSISEEERDALIDLLFLEEYNSDNNQISSKLMHYGIQEDKELIDYITRYDFIDKILPSNYESIEEFENDMKKAQLKIKYNKKIPQIKLDKIRQAYRELEFIRKNESEYQKGEVKVERLFDFNVHNDKCLSYEYKALNTVEALLNRLLIKIYIRQEEIRTPSNYGSIYDYEADKDKASFYIYNNKKVPKQLARELVKARKQLQRRGVLEQFVTFSTTINE